MEVEILNKILALGTLLVQISMIILLLAVLWKKKLDKKLPDFFEDSWNFLKENSLLLAFLTVFVGSLSSLFYSEIVGYPPCNLCWLQRTLIFPQVIILGVALWKKQKNIFDFVIGLNILGVLIACYNYYLQITQTGDCGVGGITCNKIYIWEFGYITIPMMSLTLFVVVIILTYIYKNHNGKNKGQRIIEK